MRGERRHGGGMGERDGELTSQEEAALTNATSACEME